MPQLSYKRIQKAIDQSLSILKLGQQPNGQFVGLASPKADDFSISNRHQTTFFTSLIVACLDSIPAADAIKSKAAIFILTERSAGWSWNYWLRNCKDYRLRPYPDDLDDTACAMAALAAADNTLLTQESLANFAKVLISQETNPGGPYTTWLVDSSAKADWKDIDVAVNANIAYFLKTQDIKLDGLEDYISGQINNSGLISPYYLGEIPVIYFIARWYDGPAKQQLKLAVERLLADHLELNDLQLSMILTAALNLNLGLNVLPQIEELFKRRSEHGWSAAALYYEPAVNGIKYYAGSPELTTAMAIEALQKYLNTISLSSATVPSVVASNVLTIPISKFMTENFNQKYQKYLRDIQIKDTRSQIRGIATITGHSLQIELSSEMLNSLNLASLNGWASYTLFDDYLDDEGPADCLPMAMTALRRAGYYFRQGLPTNQGFARYVEDALDIVDSANDWELAYCRPKLVTNEISLGDLPEFADLSQLAHKSWGHSIASTGVLLAAGYPLDGQNQAELQKFYFHYLIARQLNDDAHDWPDDLSNRHLSFVVTELLKGYLKANRLEHINLNTDKTALQTFFWEHTISVIINLIEENLRSARQALKNCRVIKDPAVFVSWLDDIQYATDKAAQSKVETEDFIKAFIAQ